MEKKEHMTNWEIARYLIDAKKEVDSLWYIAVNHSMINGNIKRLVELRRNTFYINAAAVVDKFVETNPEPKKFKKSLQDSNKIINQLYYYRDKHAAHKDYDFRDTEFNSIMEIVRECILILKEVKNVCETVLPLEITLDFVCYDAELFRFIFSLSKEKEDEIFKRRHSPSMESTAIKTDQFPLKIFDNTEDLWKVEDVKNYCVLLKKGITPEEDLQNRQDFCIKGNVLNQSNMWCSHDNSKYRSVRMAIKLGYFSAFMHPCNLKKTKEEYRYDLELIENAGKYLVFDLSADYVKMREFIYGKQ